jgi:hypothetical protein
MLGTQASFLKRQSIILGLNSLFDLHSSLGFLVLIEPESILEYDLEKDIFIDRHMEVIDLDVT